LSASRSRRELPERLTLLAFDLAAFAAGLRLSYELYLRTAPLPEAFAPALRFGPHGASVALGTLAVAHMLVLAAVFFFQRLYHQPRGVSRVDVAADVFRAVTVGIILTYAFASFVFPDLEYSRRIPIYNWLLTFLAVLVLRSVHREIWGFVRRRGYARERLLVVGAGPAAQDLVTRVHQQPWLGYEIVGLVDDTPGRSRARGVDVVGRTDDLGELVDSLEADEVLIALPEASRQRLLTLVSQCQREGVTIKVFPDVFQIIASEVRIGDLGGMPLLTMRDVALSGWRRTLKRAVDVLVSGTVLILLSPLILFLAVLVMIESSGQAFFVQERMGLDAKPFPILKLRTMRQDAEKLTGAVWASRGDPRRTRLGRFLRRTSLDELPQFINVLLGHMSIVGPRPERPEFVAEFRRHIPRYMERHREKAGITGWAQVNGLRGGTSIEERTEYDLYYIENWSLLFDFNIIAKTILGFLRDPNAY
jgi:exopolysaccharide biosynthesis polyprenyl glycosylphosphotransferase